MVFDFQSLEDLDTEIVNAIHEKKDFLETGDIKTKTYFHASSLGSSCYKSLIESIGLKVEIEKDNRVVFGIGTIMHREVQDFLKSKDLMRDPELNFSLELKPNYFLSGSIDGIVKIKGEECVLDLKTCAFIPEAPEEIYISQIQTYMFFTNLKKGIIFYISKVNGKRKSFEILRDDEYIKNIITKALELIEIMKDKSIPKIAYQKYCRLRDQGLCNECESLKPEKKTRKKKEKQIKGDETDETDTIKEIE